ncbi:uncharacterized protein LOC131315270 [Rhododendron vialii]|uniref:uncharacterized protein LOC131315270 n=1 Tax=Rhododendron vialii TaxID=182163 RepID=UPI00265FAE37|nr:uncharacterized protein LOC131315270 [Rhododendron vialii]
MTILPFYQLNFSRCHPSSFPLRHRANPDSLSLQSSSGSAEAHTNAYAHRKLCPQSVKHPAPAPTRSRHQIVVGYGGEVAAFGSTNPNQPIQPLSIMYSAPAKPNSFNPVGGNPFGLIERLK